MSIISLEHIFDITFMQLGIKFYPCLSVYLFNNHQFFSVMYVEFWYQYGVIPLASLSRSVIFFYFLFLETSNESKPINMWRTFGVKNNWLFYCVSPFQVHSCYLLVKLPLGLHELSHHKIKLKKNINQYLFFKFWQQLKLLECYHGIYTSTEQRGYVIICNSWTKHCNWIQVNIYLLPKLILMVWYK